MFALLCMQTPQRCSSPMGSCVVASSTVQQRVSLKSIAFQCLPSHCARTRPVSTAPHAMPAQQVSHSSVAVVHVRGVYLAVCEPLAPHLSWATKCQTKNVVHCEEATLAVDVVRVHPQTLLSVTSYASWRALQSEILSKPKETGWTRRIASVSRS